MYVRSLFILLLSLLGTIGAIGAEKCAGPTSGSIDNAPINFTYESWQKPRDRQRDWLFEHCIENLATYPLWFDWKVVGLYGYVKLGDAAFSSRTALTDAKKSATAPLWYGPAKERVDTDLTLKPNERDTASVQAPRLILAQYEDDFANASLQELLAQRDALPPFIQSLEGQPLWLYSYGRVGVPVTPDAVQNLDDPGFDSGALAEQFAMVEATLFEQISVGDGGQPVSRIGLRVSIDENEFARMYGLGYALPSVSIETEDRSLFEMLPGLDDTIGMEGPVREFIEAEAQPLSSVEAMTSRTIALTFGDGVAGMILTLESTR